MVFFTSQSKYRTEDEVGQLKSAREARKNMREARDYSANERIKDLKAELSIDKFKESLKKDARNSQTVFKGEGGKDISHVRGTIPQVENRGIHNMTTYNPFSPPERSDIRLGYNGFSLGETGRDLHRASVMDIVKDNPHRINIWQ